jgi:hypothetical protein
MSKQRGKYEFISATPAGSMVYCRGVAISEAELAEARQLCQQYFLDEEMAAAVAAMLKQDRERTAAEGRA